jgi:hypothetical protein
MKPFKLLSLHFDRHFSKGVYQQILWLAGIMLVVYAVLASLSYVEFLYTPNNEEIPHWYDRFRDILLVLIDPGSGSRSMSSSFTVICAILGLVIFSGMLISVISNVLERRVESYLKGETDYRFDHHVVILGFNKSIPSLLATMKNKYPDSYLVIMCNQDIDSIRDWLYANVSRELMDSVILMNGVRNAEYDLERLRLTHQVREIFILGEEDELAHDAVNLECVKMISKLLKENDAKVECHVQMLSDSMTTVLQKVKADEDITEKLSFLPFNFNEIWALNALATTPGKMYYKPLDGKGIGRGSNKHVHLIIVGLNSMSWSMAVNAAHILHFPNFVEGNFDTCSTISIIDSEAGEKSRAFRSRYQHLFNMARWRMVTEEQCVETGKYWTDPLGDDDSCSPFKHLGPVNFMDIQWEFIEGDVYEDHIMQYLEICAEDKNAVTTIALSFEDSDVNSTICLSLPESIRIAANEILVRQNESDVAIEQLRKAYGFENIRAFGMMSNCYEENLNTDKYGKLINGLYKGCALDDSEDDNAIIENSWKSAESIDRCSSNYCANMLFVKLRFMGLDTTKPLTRDEIEHAVDVHKDVIQTTEHNRWITER